MIYFWGIVALGCMFGLGYMTGQLKERAEQSERFSDYIQKSAKYAPRKKL
jgi:hypothetical protein